MSVSLAQLQEALASGFTVVNKPVAVAGWLSECSRQISEAIARGYRVRVQLVRHRAIHATPERLSAFIAALADLVVCDLQTMKPGSGESQ